MNRETSVAVIDIGSNSVRLLLEGQRPNYIVNGL